MLLTESDRVEFINTLWGSVIGLGKEAWFRKTFDRNPQRWQAVPFAMID